MKGFVLESDDTYLLGVLNSSVVWWFLVQTCSPLGDPRHGGRLQLKTQYTSKIPIPSASKQDKAAIEALVDEILHTLRQDPDANVTKPESEINQVVYKLFGLSFEEIDEIETACR